MDNREPHETPAWPDPGPARARAEARMRGAVAIVLALVAGALIGYFAHDRAPAVRGDEASAGNPQLAQLQARIARLEAQDRGGAYRAAEPARASTSPVPEAALQSQAQRVAAMRAQERQLQQALDAVFSGSAAAPPGDHSAQRVDDALAAAEVVHATALPQSEDVDCRATLCLVRARFGPGQDSADWVDRLLLEMGTTLPGATVVPVAQPDGGTEIRIYATRPGDPTPIEIAQARRTQ